MAENTNLAFRSIGEGFPILFVPGWTITGDAEAFDFEPVFTSESGYRRIYIDLPGMGKTPAGTIQNLDDIYTSTCEFARQHLGSTSFLLAGTSCGAYLARALAYEFSSQVQGLLLRVPLIEPDNAKRDIDPVKPVIEDTELKAKYLSLESNIIPVHTQPYLDRYQKKLDQVILPAVASAESKVLDPIRNDTERYVIDKPMHTAAQPFSWPTLIIAGRQDDVVGYREAWKLLEAYPRASFVALDRADHGFPIDDDALFKVLVLDWLKRVEETKAVRNIKA